MKKKIIFALVVLLLLGGTAITFSQNSASASVTITAGGNNGDISTIKTIADIDTDTGLKYSTGDSGAYTAVPASWSPVVNTAGTVTKGDLYYVDTTGYTGDVLVTVYMTNAGMLVRDYNYLDFQVNVWSGTSGSWTTQATRADGSPIGTVFLTEINGSVNLVLAGATKYCITIDGGSYYCISTSAAGGSLSPAFYIEVKQAYLN
jgi:hypothetical protein